MDTITAIATESRPRRAHKQRTENLPNKLRQYRLARGLTLPLLAAQIGVTIQALRQAEVRGNGIGKDKWYKLADLFDVDPRILEAP